MSKTIKVIMLLMTAVVVLTQTGCVFVRVRAGTVLKFRNDTSKSEYVSVGFRDVQWAVVDGKITLAGYGWHFE